MIRHTNKNHKEVHSISSKHFNIAKLKRGKLDPTLLMREYGSGSWEKAVSQVTQSYAMQGFKSDRAAYRAAVLHGCNELCHPVPSSGF